MNDSVRLGYDLIAERYAASRDQFKSVPYLERVATLLPARARVLDIGCGSGVPAARFLTDHGFSVAGLDILPRMIELATANVPKATFEVRDMLSLRPGDCEVDCIVALYSVFHVNRENHAELLQVFRSFLGTGGVMLLTMGAEKWEGSEPDFYGVEMSWSHFGPERNREMIESAGFRIEVDEIDTSGDEQHQVLIARAVREGAAHT